jgi:hypothetical protein
MNCYEFWTKHPEKCESLPCSYQPGFEKLCPFLKESKEKQDITLKKTFDEECYNTTNMIAELIVSKQKDYGKSNILDFGEMGILIRSNDKFARLKNLILNNKNPNNESKIDTWKDIAGYAIIALMLENGSFSLPLDKEK